MFYYWYCYRFDFSNELYLYLVNHDEEVFVFFRLLFVFFRLWEDLSTQTSNTGSCLNSGFESTNATNIFRYHFLCVSRV